VADEDSSVSPYLLRPLRSLEQVASGRSRAIHPRLKRVEELQPRNGRDELRQTIDKEYISGDPTDCPLLP
jgi:hypothetical protein